MGNLAGTYSALGRHSEALAMQESVLEFRRRVLPAEHPDIGEGRVWSAAALDLTLTSVSGLALYRLSLCHEQSGALALALQAAVEALRLLHACDLPPAHKYVVDAEALVRRLEEAEQ